MLPPLSLIRKRLATIIDNKGEQGHVIDGLHETLDTLPDSYDALSSFSQKLTQLPMRPDWPYLEPSDWEGIQATADPSRPLGPLATVDDTSAAEAVAAAFLTSVCGCMLGKAIEVNPTLDELHAAAQRSGTAWPFEHYVDEAFLSALGRRHVCWVTSALANITAVAPDDDINYTLIGMLALERKGAAFTQEDLADLWFRYLPLRYCHGPERTQLVKTSYASMTPHEPFHVTGWADQDNPQDEKCGALIRVDAYGYAYPGDPAKAVELAWRDASWTHRRTGIYGALFVAAAIAGAFVIREPLKLFATALAYVPQKSRFHEIVSDCLCMVEQAKDWQSAYRGINQRYGHYRHGSIYQEIGCLINAVHFADNADQGIAMQVAQGNDTDSFGATAGSILGILHGRDGLSAHWLQPFRDRITLGMAGLGEVSLSDLAQRMGRLPAHCQKLQTAPVQESAEGMALHPDTGLPIAPAFH